jgi:hypothetical protein
VAPRWAESTNKHGVPRADQIHAIVNATYKARIEVEDDVPGEVWLYIGRPHPQTEREIEVLVKTYSDGRTALVFHAMELGPNFRRRREEHPDGD